VLRVMGSAKAVDVPRADRVSCRRLAVAGKISRQLRAWTPVSFSRSESHEKFHAYGPGGTLRPAHRNHG
jgi:hypothetical protein